jgi:hypothetical protein
MSNPVQSSPREFSVCSVGQLRFCSVVPFLLRILFTKSTKDRLCLSVYLSALVKSRNAWLIWITFHMDVMPSGGYYKLVLLNLLKSVIPTWRSKGTCEIGTSIVQFTARSHNNVSITITVKQKYTTL